MTSLRCYQRLRRMGNHTLEDSPMCPSRHGGEKRNCFGGPATTCDAGGGKGLIFNELAQLGLYAQSAWKTVNVAQERRPAARQAAGRGAGRLLRTS